MPFKKGYKPWNRGKKTSEQTLKKLRIVRKGNTNGFKKGQPSFNKGKHILWMMGPKNPNWRGGTMQLNEKIRKSIEYKLWRKAVFERDNYQCIWGGKEHGNKLHADHIKPFYLYPELRFAIDNGRTLCEDCHRKTETWGRPKNVSNY